MRRSSLPNVLALAVLLTPLHPAQAQTSAVPTLAQALALAQQPTQTLYMTVDAAKVTLPQGAAPPPADSHVPQVAEAYGRLRGDYDTVSALAPPQMTVVYSPPDTPNPYDGMPPGQVMKLLTATFTKDQWKAFMGTPTGIGYGDMAGDAQRRLFEALFPGGHLVIERDNPTGPNDPNSKRDISGDPLTQAHLRLGYMVSVALQEANKPDTHVFAGGPEPADTPARYFMLNAQSEDVDREYGAQVRETMDNVLKPGQLDWDMPSLQSLVPLGGVRTVDDLVTRIGVATRLELYADRRYGSRTVTFYGPAKSARADDLLRALALCVTGTYRQVGPAYVLTDDLVGIGTKHAQWKAFEARAQALLPGASLFQAPGPTPDVPYTIQDISWGDDPMAFSADEQKRFWTQWRTNPEQDSNGMMDLTLPLDQLSPVQQEVARQTQQYNSAHGTSTTLDGTVMVQAEPMLEISLPTLDGTIIVFQSYQSLLPYPALSPAEQAANAKRMEGQDPVFFPGAAPAPARPLRPLVQSFARRAVRIAPTSPQEVTRDLTALRALGFNEVWLQVLPDADEKSIGAARLLITQAVREGRKDGIAVLPDLSLLRWADGTAADLMDLDLMGLTPTQAAKESSDTFLDPNARDTVTPFSPEVAQRMTAWVGALGSVPGIGGMVWEDVTPPGYQAFTPDGPDESQGDSLGFALAGRLAYLRYAHTDPVDLYTNYDTDERAHVVVPGFNEDFNQERTLYDMWRGLRTRTDQVLAQNLAAALPPPFQEGTARLPLIVPPANSTFSSVYGSWDNPLTPLPSEQFISPLGPDGQPLMGVPMTEQMPSRLFYHQLNVYAAPTGPAQQWANAVAVALDAARHRGERNIVLGGGSDPALLEALAAREQPNPAAPTGRATP